MNILITGGAGFIGHHAARHFRAQGHAVTIFDNLSRPGSTEMAETLMDEGLTVLEFDVRDRAAVEGTVRSWRPDVVLHLAGQVAVTTSVEKPWEDFEINALGTMHVLEALRRFAPHAITIYASTNKVYGKIAPEMMPPSGWSEEYPLRFWSPYGCSKGAGDQYMLDYARIYGMRTVALRQSCIYGHEQWGIEDQGWVAWFCNRAVTDQPVTLYGDGRQVRDLLWIEDLLALYDAIIAQPEHAAGQAYNVGGGPRTAMSLRGVLEELGQVRGRPMDIHFGPTRAGDQPFYISNVDKALVSLGWKPRMLPNEGIRRLYEWMVAHVDEIPAEVA